MEGCYIQWKSRGLLNSYFGTFCRCMAIQRSGEECCHTLRVFMRRVHAPWASVTSVELAFEVVPQMERQGGQREHGVSAGNAREHGDITDVQVIISHEFHIGVRDA